MIEVVQAFDRALIAKLESDDAAALERKIQGAARLFADRGAWLRPHQRIDILRKLAGLMEGRREHFGCQIAREGGKPLTDALIETDRAIDGVRNAADELRVMTGQEIPMGLTPASIDRRAFTIVEPIGVVAAISAFNHPLNLIVHQVVPAIAVGCPVIVKPASSTRSPAWISCACSTRPGCLTIGARSFFPRPTSSPRRSGPIRGLLS
jgi:acyl-CoA reductase-like NAD-dependent aldehyde dehydrogenase